MAKNIVFNFATRKGGDGKQKSSNGTPSNA